MLLAFLLATSLGIAAEDPQALADRYNTLVGNLDPTGPSSGQYDAFRYLVEQGPKGWELLIQAQFETGFRGDAARRIHSFCETSTIPKDLVDGYERAQRAELLKRVPNETWALLYAGACERVEFHARVDTYFVRLNGLFESLQKHPDQSTEALINVAFLRVMLVATPAFPGHRFPWTAPAAQRKQAVRQLIDWWQANRNEHKPKDA
jgi:hypothetical protein